MRILISILFIFIFSCATSPTGRQQVLLFSDPEINRMGSQAFSELKQNTPRETRSDLQNYVQCVAQAILRVSRDQTGVQTWEIQVFRKDDINAFALPGGKIGVFTGLLKVAKNADQLATVLGHEVAHVVARHGNERVSQAMLTQGGLLLVGAALKNWKNENKNLLLAGAGIATHLGLTLRWGRDQESEADTVGLKLMASAGFDPRQSVELWKNMRAASGGSLPEFLSTHPSHSTRIDDLSSHLKEALELQKMANDRGRIPRCEVPRSFIET